MKRLSSRFRRSNLARSINRTGHEKRKKSRRIQLESLETRHLLAAVGGEVYFDTNADGLRQTSEIGVADVSVYADFNANGEFDLGTEPQVTTDADGRYSFPSIPAGDVEIRILTDPGLVQTAPAVTFGWDNRIATDPDGQLFRAAQLIQIDGNGTVEAIGQPTTQRMDGLVRIADGSLIGVDTRSNEVFRVDPFNGERSLISRTDLDIDGGLAYDRVTNSVFTLVRADFGTTSRNLATIDVNTGETTVIGRGISGLTKVSDLEFDAVNRRVIGFDDADDQFFAFNLLGSAASLSFTDRMIDSDALSIADPASMPTIDLGIDASNSTFVLMFDDDDSASTGTFLVNVDTGEVFDAADSNSPLQPTALTRSALGNNAQSISVEATDSLTTVDFGIAEDVIGFRLTALRPETGPGSLSQSGVTVVGGAIGNDFVEVTLNRRPDSNVVLNLELNSRSGGETGAVLDVDQLTFTPEDWDQPRLITISPNVESPVAVTTSSTLDVSIDIANSDLAWRTLTPQQLPVRTLPESGIQNFTRPVINEILIESQFGFDFDEESDQYIELRGNPNEVLPAGSYFVVVEEANSIGSRIHSIFDLSGQSFGPNGFLVILQSGSTHEVALGANVLEASTGRGFTDLPSNRFQGNIDGSLDPVFNNGSYLLIQSDTPPVLQGQLDSDRDGFIDPEIAASNWTVLDSVAMQDFSVATTTSIASIVFAESLSDTVVTRNAAGQVRVSARGYGYVGRIGDSIGSEFNDWVLGSVASLGADNGGIETDSEGRYEFTDNEISFPALHDRPLDHVGSSNFVGGVRGQVSLLPSAADILDGTPPETRLPAEGVTVFVDTNNNGIRDNLVFEVDPDAVVPPFSITNPDPFFAEYSLTNAFPGVVITTDIGDGIIIRDDVVSTRQDVFGQTLANRVFSQGGFTGFSELSSLRFDFHNPIESATIEVFQRSFTSIVAFGRLDAFNRAGDLVASSIGSGVNGGLTGSVTVSAPGAEIVRVEAYGDSNFGSLFVGFDSFSYVQAEPAATTDANGIYEISGLFPGDYTIDIQDTLQVSNLVPTAPQSFTISRYENFFFESEFRANSPPQLLTGSDFDFDVFENPVEDTIVGRITGFDADLEPLTYEFIGGNSEGLQFQTRADGSADILVGPNANLDFETEPERILTVRISDQSSSTTARVQLTINDVNEPPVISPNELAVTEDTVVNNQDGVTIGLIAAFDPETGTSDDLTYEIIGGSDVLDENNQVIANATDFFVVDANTGVVNLIQTPNFEVVQLLTLQVRVTDKDGGVSVADKNIRVGDENDAPTINATSFQVAENQTGDLFQLQVVDPDAGQSHAFALVPPADPSQDIFGVRSDGTVFLRPGQTLDFDGVTPNTLSVVVSDNGSPPQVSTHDITVNLDNVDEPARILLPSEGGNPFELPEDATNFVGIVALELRDPEGLHSDYAFDLLPGPSSELFEFDPTTGILRVASGQSLDFELEPFHDLSFEIFDRTGQIATTQQRIRINVLNVNEPATILTNEITVSEIPEPGDIIGRINAVDPEQSPLSISIIGGTAAEFFEFAGPEAPFSLRVKGDTNFDFEAPDPPEGRTLIVEVTQADTSLPAIQKTITIRLNEVNEEPIFDDASVASLLVIPAVPNEDTPLRLTASGFTITLPRDLAVDPDPLPVRPEEGNPNLVRPELIFRVGQQVLDEDGNVVLNERERPTLALPQWLTYDAETQTIIGDFSNGFTSVPELTIRALESGPLPLATDAALTFPAIEPTNLTNRFDVNDDGAVTPLDALRVINFLNGNLADSTTLEELFAQVRFLDVSGAVDGLSQITSLDAIQLINEINRIEGSSNVGATSEPLSAVETQIAVSGDDADDERLQRELAVDAALGQTGLF